MNAVQKVAIFYFSGTGNARRIAFWLAEFAAKMGIECQTYDIVASDAKKTAESIANALVLIISPTHGFNFPPITLKFIRRFPKGNNDVVLMNTRAGMKIGKWVTPGLTGIALMLAALILKAKGYRIKGQVSFDMPSNWLAIHPSLREEAIKYLHQVNYQRVAKHAARIFSGQRDFQACRGIVQDILVAPIALAYYCLGRFALAKLFYASAECDSCGLCVEQCPVQAIKMVDGRPYWTFQCESCMRCMNNCPQKAIEVGHGLLLVVSILSWFALKFFLRAVLHLEITSVVIKLLLWSIISLGFLWVFYYGQHFLLRNRILSKLTSLTSLTHYRFWGRYNSIPDSQWRE